MRKATLWLGIVPLLATFGSVANCGTGPVPTSSGDDGGAPGPGGAAGQGGGPAAQSGGPVGQGGGPAAPGSGGSGAAGGPDSSVACTPDDGVDDPACADAPAIRCNGKCFTTSGECKAGCLLVGKADFPLGIAFENGVAFAYGHSNVTRIDLKTHATTSVSGINGPSADQGVVKDGVFYWATPYDDHLYKLGPDGVPTPWVQAADASDAIVGLVGSTIYFHGRGQLHGVPIGGTAVTTVLDDLAGFHYDATYLYLLDPSSNPVLGFYRAKPDSIAKPEYLNDTVPEFPSHLVGDYFYTVDLTDTGDSALKRFPNTGGAAVPFATVPSKYGTFVSVADVVFALDYSTDTVVRIRSTTDQTVVARIGHGEHTLATDGKSVYVATAAAGPSGAIFRIVE